MPGIAGHHHGVQRADVDAQLQRVGRHHGADLAVAQLAFDLAALPRQIAAAIAANGSGAHRPSLAGVLQIGDQDFGRQPVVREHERLLAAVDELERDAARLVEIAAPDAELPVHHRRIVEDEVLLAATARRCARPVRTAVRSALRPVPSDWRWWPSSR